MLCSLHKGMSGLEILAANYGAQGSDKDMVDVTDKIKAKVWPSGEGISIMVSPTSIGVADPSPQSQKVLVVRYRINGGTETAVKTPDAATFAVTVPGTSPTSSLGHAGSLYGMLWTNALAAAGIFVLVMSAAFAYRLGSDGGYGSWILFVAIALMMPYIGISGIVLVVLIHTAVSGKFVAFGTPTMMGGIARAAHARLRGLRA